MAKSKSELISAAGVLMSIITALMNAVRKQGGTDEDIYRLVTPDGELLVDDIAKLLVEAGNKPAKPLSAISGCVLEIPALPENPNALATKKKDPNSPFGFRNLHAKLCGQKSGATKIQGHTLDQNMTFTEMVEAVGGEEEIRAKHIVTPEQIRHMVDQQKNGGSGALLTNGYINFFFVLAEDSSLAVVRVRWAAYCRYWNVWSSPVSRSSVWGSGLRLLLRA